MRQILQRLLLDGGSSVIAYTLRDLFTTDRAAGSVNGTLAEPSGQVRTVTDTNSKLSITGGVASFATGGVGAGNPGLWYPSQTSVAGLILLGRLIITTDQIQFGWDSGASGGLQLGFQFISANRMSDLSNGASSGLWVAGTTYNLAVILRASGVWLLIKGGAFTNWTLLWLSVLAGSNPVFPGVVVNNTTGVATVDDVRIPADLYIPSPLAYDTFTRANGALGSTETTGPDAQAIAALVWNFTAGIWAIATNAARGTPTTGADIIVNGGFATDTVWTKGAGWTIAAGVADAATASSTSLFQVVGTAGAWYQMTWTITAYTSGNLRLLIGTGTGVNRATAATFTETGHLDTAFTGFNTASAATASVDNVSYLLLALAELMSSVLVSTADAIVDVAITLTSATSGFQAGLVLNLDSTSSPANFIVCYLNGNGACVLKECVAGAYTTKFATAITYSAGAVLRVIRDGTSCRVFYNNAAVSTVQTMTANVNKNHGLFSTNASNSFDNFTIWPRGTSNEFSTLDIY